MAELVLTRHARLSVDRRGIKRGDLRACVYYPDTVEPGKGFRMELRKKQIGSETLAAIIRPTRRKLLLVTVYWVGDRSGSDESSSRD